MAPRIPKRRKLDYDGHKELSAIEDGSENDGIENRSFPMSPAEALAVPMAKTQVRPKRTLQGDEAAIYAGGNYKSSLFKLQVDELLSEVRPNYEKRLSGVDDALRRLKGLIEGIGERDALPVSGSLS